MMPFSTVVVETKLKLYGLRETAIFTLYSSTTAIAIGFTDICTGWRKATTYHLCKNALLQSFMMWRHRVRITLDNNFIKSYRVMFCFLKKRVNCLNLINKLAINACKVLVQQMFLVKCWFVELLHKNGLTKICLISQCCMQLEPIS